MKHDNVCDNIASCIVFTYYWQVELFAFCCKTVPTYSYSQLYDVAYRG